MMPKNRPADLEGSIQKLSVDGGIKKSNKPSRQKKDTVADSWEDASISSPDEDGHTSAKDGGGSLESSDYPGPPPPTPASPRFTSHSRGLSRNAPVSKGPIDGYTTIDFDQNDRPSSRPSTSSQTRPEKTTATASRMIAAGLGVKAPKRTEEERRYDRAVRDNERKRREEAKEAERAERERLERCKKDMWGDD